MKQSCLGFCVLNKAALKQSADVVPCAKISSMKSFYSVDVSQSYGGN